MPSLWFICPAHGRAKLARICLTQLRRTCDLLTAAGIEARAFVIADDENLDTARDLGFGYVERDNQFVSKRFSDGFQYALDPQYHANPADYVVPIGSDDWVDHRLFLDLPPRNTMVGFRDISFVREDGREINTTYLDNLGGSGIRIFPRHLIEPLGWRPADESFYRGCDTSILVNLQRVWGDKLRVDTRRAPAHWLVDWKTPGENLNTYDEIARRRRRTSVGDPFVELDGLYPDEALDAMQAHYARQLVAA